VSDPALVGVVMGSDSDWATMAPAAEALAEFDVGHEVRVVSAHRTPRDMLDYAATAADRGLRVIIAGAGGAAHLPGMLASSTPLPVIGVPVPLAHLDGLDSLLSIVQMPAGVPVATVSVAGARNGSSRPPMPGCGSGWSDFRPSCRTLLGRRTRRCASGSARRSPPADRGSCRPVSATVST